ncbi:hypothetical protein TNCV_4768641 [Trichonephila clavipes]|nr:hypothetical protein TNCV_4768641 [Trichonephila clavipes]
MHHIVSHGGLHRRKREAQRITAQTSIPYPGFEPSPYGTAVSVTDHCNRWAACEGFQLSKSSHVADFDQLL